MAKVGAFAAMLHGTLVRMKADGVPGNPVVWLQKYLAKHALVVGQQSVSCRRNIHWLEAELMKQAAPGRKPRLTENDKKKLQRALRSLITLPTPDNVYVAHRKLRELDTDKKELVMRVRTRCKPHDAAHVPTSRNLSARSRR